MAWGRSQYRDVPDAFGRDKNGRMPKGGHTANSAKVETDNKLKKAKGGKTKTLTDAEQRAAIKKAKAAEKELKKAAKKGR